MLIRLEENNFCFHKFSIFCVEIQKMFHYHYPPPGVAILQIHSKKQIILWEIKKTLRVTSKDEQFSFVLSVIISTPFGKHQTRRVCMG